MGSKQGIEKMYLIIQTFKKNHVRIYIQYTVIGET